MAHQRGRLPGKRPAIPTDARPPKSPEAEPEEPAVAPRQKAPAPPEGALGAQPADAVSDAAEGEGELRVPRVNSEDEEEQEDVMLAGGRRELNRKGPKRASPEGAAQINDGIGKEVGNLFDKEGVDSGVSSRVK